MPDTIEPDFTDDERPTDEELARFREQRIMTIIENGMVRRETCERCGALPGEDCRSREFYVGQFHAARRKAAGVR